jgi:hypothetical protein
MSYIQSLGAIACEKNIPMEKLNSKMIVGLISIFTMTIGITSMLYCLNYLHSSKIEDLIGAGFPFLSGTILFTGGLVSLSIIASSNKS